MNKETIPEAWIGRQIGLRVWDGDNRHNLNCKLEAVNDRGIFVEIMGAELPAFYPWTAVLRISTVSEQEERP